ncbi:MAG: sugar ABC transporter permease [Lachnospiraceae bacterium]|nr:sugar ABC transporter permease [Lachnospiraceae bacterium]MBQ7782096.1 sugar ABC transporter permease [Lachnospiraceae bacterium]
MEKNKTGKERIAGYIYYVARIGVLLSIVMMFFPGLNPAKICDFVNKTMSLFTSGISYGSLTEQCVRAFNQGWIQESSFIILFISSLITWIGIAITAVMGCMSIGNLKMKRLGNWFGIGGALVQMLGLGGIYLAYTQVAATTRPEKVMPNFPLQNWLFFFVIAVVVLVTTLVIQLMLPKPAEDAKYEMESKFKLFLMFLPFAALCFVFSYLPLYGWRYAFYDYQAGGTLSSENFVGFQWFTMLFQNEATRSDIVRVLRNTLVMSGLGIATSWLPMAFAIFLSEIKSQRMKRFVQTFATIPNFISWVLVYAIALAIFSSEGFISSLMVNSGAWEAGKNMLMGDSGHWFKMLAWGTWKGVGWSAIIYIAGIAGIDQQLYEAATVDGAGRFQKMWHITLPGLIPTYMVMLLMAVAGCLSNGMDQYMVFDNATNTNVNMVLDLYVYKLGIVNGAIPLSTMIGMVKSVVSVVLLFLANTISKLVRGESIV